MYIGPKNSLDTDMRNEEQRKDARYSATGCLSFSVGGVLVFIGVIAMVAGDKYGLPGVIMFTGGMVILLFTAIAPLIDSKKKKEEKKPQYYLLYNSLIGNYRSTPLAHFSKHFSKNEKKVIIDLQSMIDDGYLQNAFIDYDNKELIVKGNKEMRVDSTTHYCFNCGAKYYGSPKFCSECGVSLVLDIKQRIAEEIDEAKRQATIIMEFSVGDSHDEKIKEQASKVYNRLLSIFSKIEEGNYEAWNYEMQSLTNLYLPAIYRILNNYLNLDAKIINDKEKNALESDIERTLDVLANTFDGMYKKINEESVMDISAEVDALIMKLNIDGKM